MAKKQLLTNNLSLTDRPQLKRKLVSAIIGSLKDVKPKNWALSKAYLTYLQKGNPVRKILYKNTEIAKYIF